jgi:flagellar L-ring protein precursor FlgH
MRTRSELSIERSRVVRIRWAVALGSFLLLSSAFAFSARADSLFSAAVEERGHLYSDEEVWFEVGDVITVLVSETTDARTRASTETEKESSLEANASSEFLTGSNGLNILKSGELPAWQFEGKNEHDGGGTTQRNNTVSAMVSTRVVEVLSGGNLRIEGYKNLVVNREKTRITIRGIIRDRDVTPRNTVLSSQIADAEISFDGGGPLWDSQRRGLLTRLLDFIWPF